MMARFWRKIWGPFLLAILLVAALAGSASAASEPPWATGQSQPEDIQVKLVIFGPGDDVVSWFGHIALVVEDTRLDHRRLYNYGMFSFDDGMLAKFAMGRLWFWVGQGPVYGTYEMYKRQGRSVRVLTLNLPPQERMEMAEFLAWNVRPKNREYLYHHYFDNCSTRIRDALDKAVGGQLHEATAHQTGKTFRDHTRRHAAHNPPMEMLLMFLMNNSIDEPVTRWEEMFLPAELEEVVTNFEYVDAQGNKVPLISEELVYYDADRAPVPDTVPTHWPGALLFGLLMGGGAVLLGRPYFKAADATPSRPAKGWRVAFGLYNALIGLVVGIPGLALAVMWIVTDHTVTYHGENLFLGNPLTFLLLPLGIALAVGSTRARGWLRSLWMVLAGLGLILLPLKFLPFFDQHNLLPIVFILPILLGFGLVWWRLGAPKPAAEA